MTILLQQASRISPRVLTRLSTRKLRVGVHQLRCFSDSSEPQPLFLWLGKEGSSTTTTTSEQHATNKLLLPVSPPSEPTVFTPEDVLASVNAYYESDQNFVGGMGESDPGVRFATTGGGADDTLDYAALVQESIALVKQERHGVPFSLYTSGIPSQELAVPLAELGLESLQVSLFCASPPDYCKATGRDAAAFGKVCGFIADAAEQGIAVEVGILSAYASGAHDLALALGARHVHVYNE